MRLSVAIPGKMGLQKFMLVAEGGIYLVSVAILVALGIPAVLIII